MEISQVVLFCYNKESSKKLNNKFNKLIHQNF